MNFLAHLHLADPGKVASPQCLAGNLMPDLVRGKLPVDLPAEVWAGVECHRNIDRWCDTHPAFIRTRQRLFTTQGRFAGVVADMLFDHALALRWEAHHSLSLPDFIEACYAGLSQPEAQATMPPRMRGAIELMVSQDWLGRYRTEAGMDVTFRQMSARFSQRLGRAVRLESAIDDLRAQRDELLIDFDELFAYLLHRLSD